MADSRHLFRSPLARVLARPASWVYGAAVALRPVPVPKHPGVPVISIGNIHVGGTGKTPLVIAVARFLKECGWNPAVVSRGFRGRLSSAGAEVTPSTTAIDAGDEPVEIAARCPGVSVVIGADRVRAAQRAARQSDVIILDDGFQHRKLARNLDIVCLPDGFSPADETLLPHGLLREPYEALGRAAAVVCFSTAPQSDVSNSGVINVEELKNAEKIKRFTGARLFSASREVDSVIPYPGTTDPVSLLGRSVVVFSGIGRPGLFVEAVRSCGAEIADHFSFPDHHYYSESDLAAIRDAVTRHGSIAVMTGKDAARLGGRPLGFPAAVLRARVESPALFDFVRGALTDAGPKVL